MKCDTLMRTFKMVCLVSALTILGGAAPSQAANKNKAWTDPESARKEDPDAYAPFTLLPYWEHIQRRAAGMENPTPSNKTERRTAAISP